MAPPPACWPPLPCLRPGCTLHRRPARRPLYFRLPCDGDSVSLARCQLHAPLLSTLRCTLLYLVRAMCPCVPLLLHPCPAALLRLRLASGLPLCSGCATMAPAPARLRARCAAARHFPAQLCASCTFGFCLTYLRPLAAPRWVPILCPCGHNPAPFVDACASRTS